MSRAPVAWCMNVVPQLAGLTLLAAVLEAQDRPSRPVRGFSPPAAAQELATEARLAALLDADSTERHFRYLTAEPHPAGSERNNALAEYVAAAFRQSGLDEVLVHRYDVLLPWPRDVSVEMLAPHRFHASLREEVYAEEGVAADDVGLTYIGMSASGDVTGPLVYANSGNPEDYDWLEQQGVTLDGAVAIVRYSVPYSYRGFKALTAERRGIKAMLVYSDPAEDGYAKGLTYPDGPWGPASHLQRGAITYDFLVPGDPLTPGWASVEGERRIARADARSVPKVVAVPLSYRDARPLLEALTGPVAPPGWQGALPFAYHVGPGATTVRVRVDMDDAIRPIYVVEGRLIGAEHPDELVILGNHRDAWVYGGVDPSSGTATQLELARALGTLTREGQRPKRTIVFASWDAEEWHLTGSTEWGEQFAERLAGHTVAYLNVDGSTSGSEFLVGAVASLNPLIAETLRDVPDPHTGHSLLSDTQAGFVENELGSGSDYTVFLNFLGIPIVGMAFDGPYGVYHSRYDNYDWMARFGDPGFRYMTAMGDVWGRMALRLANAEVLPFDFSGYAARVGDFIATLAERPEAKEHLDLGPARDAQRAWLAAAEHLESAVSPLLGNPSARERRATVNRALLDVERQLLLEEGIPGRPWFKHALYAPRFTYDAMTLPGIEEALDDGDWARARDQVIRLAERLTAVARALDAATRAAAP